MYFSGFTGCFSGRKESSSSRECQASCYAGFFPTVAPAYPHALMTYFVQHGVSPVITGGKFAKGMRIGIYL
jgi:hypothetical protein